MAQFVGHFFDHQSFGSVGLIVYQFLDIPLEVGQLNSVVVGLVHPLGFVSSLDFPVPGLLFEEEFDLGNYVAGC